MSRHVVFGLLLAGVLCGFIRPPVFAEVVENSPAGFATKSVVRESGVSGSLTWELAGKDEVTEATLSYVVGGFRPGGLQGLASLVDSVLNGQLLRLKNFVERGTP